MKLLEWKKKLGRPECPYVHRWVLNLYFISFRLHHFLRSDDDRALHDHPWWYVTVILKGHYEDVFDSESITLRPGDVAFRHAHHKHTVKTSEVWTFLITGRESRIWGFYPEGKFKRREKYFKRFGHHPCDQA